MQYIKGELANELYIFYYFESILNFLSIHGAYIKGS
jgi:hypothetical protein